MCNSRVIFVFPFFFFFNLEIVKFQKNLKMRIWYIPLTKKLTKRRECCLSVVRGVMGGCSEHSSAASGAVCALGACLLTCIHCCIRGAYVLTGKVATVTRRS